MNDVKHTRPTMADKVRIAKVPVSSGDSTWVAHAKCFGVEIISIVTWIKKKIKNSVIATKKLLKSAIDEDDYTLIFSINEKCPRLVRNILSTYRIFSNKIRPLMRPEL